MYSLAREIKATSYMWEGTRTELAYILHNELGFDNDIKLIPEGSRYMLMTMVGDPEDKVAEVVHVIVTLYDHRMRGLGQELL